MALTHVLEWLAMALGLCQVILAWQNERINFIFGAASVIIFIYLFYTGSLYADATLNSYYFLISVLGWWQWRNTNNKPLPISRCSKTEHIMALTIATGAFFISYIVLINYTNSEVPVADSALSAFAWAGSWLMTKRKLENWLWLNISNLIAIPLYLYKSYTITAGYTVILFVVAMIGYRDWKRQLLAN